MKIVIFAGGTGKRFWPVSRENAPKQFSPLISGKPLLRMRIDTLLKGYNPEDIFISTGAKYEKEAKKLAPELPTQNFIIEPEMRDTGPAVTLAVAYINNLFPNENISIQWSDHLNKDEATYISTLKESERLIDNEIKVVLITVPVRFPSPHRGYIQFGKKLKSVSKKIEICKFIKFKEKPDIETAKRYFKSKNHGWNPGYWTIDPRYYLSLVQKFSPETYNVCTQIVNSGFGASELKKFCKLEKISADYLFAENIEKEKAVSMISDFGWCDVGEWISLKEALQKSDEDNVIRGNVIDMDSTDSIIFNLDDKKLVSTIELNGFVVVNTPDTVAIFHKDNNTKLKEFLKILEEKGYSYLL